MISSLSPILDLFRDADSVIEEPLRGILEQAGQIVEDHTVEREITDWPFEKFWGHPYEPLHSKLLRYFIDPVAKHGCGPFLLQAFVGTLVKALDQSQPSHKFPFNRPDDFWHGCHVDAETRGGDGQPGQMDLWIQRPCECARFAIIIENKINRAPNQPNQLQRYVAKAKMRGFDEKELFVFFLPLTDDCDPDEKDRKAIQDKGVTYAKITFAEHIRQWLAVVDEWPQNLDKRICEHVSYYRNLITHLTNRRKDEIMSEKILDRLKLTAKDASEGKARFPSWEDLQRLETSTRVMMLYFKRMLRGKLLLSIDRILNTSVKTESYRTNGSVGTADPCSIVSEWDECFDTGVDLCIPVTNVVRVCIGADCRDDGGPMKPFWIGYLRVGLEEQQAEVESEVIALANAWFREPPERGAWWTNKPWYKYHYLDEVTYADCEDETTAHKLAEQLLEMRDYLAERLPPPPRETLI